NDFVEVLMRQAANSGVSDLRVARWCPSVGLFLVEVLRVQRPCREASLYVVFAPPPGARVRRRPFGGGANESSPLDSPYHNTPSATKRRKVTGVVRSARGQNRSPLGAG